jgi:hypothetical protein
LYPPARFTPGAGSHLIAYEIRAAGGFRSLLFGPDAGAATFFDMSGRKVVTLQPSSANGRKIIYLPTVASGHYVVQLGNKPVHARPIRIGRQ